MVTVGNPRFGMFAALILGLYEGAIVYGSSPEYGDLNIDPKMLESLL